MNSLYVNEHAQHRQKAFEAWKRDEKAKGVDPKTLDFSWDAFNLDWKGRSKAAQKVRRGDVKLPSSI